MSQEAMNKQTGDRDISRMVNERGVRKNYEGFEGMNYEQIRQPYNPKYSNRHRTNDEAKHSKRPDEG